MRKKNNIIAKLRLKLIVVSMLVTLTVLGLIIGGINFANYQKISNEADRTVEYLIEHYGKEEIKPEPPLEMQGKRHGPFDEQISPEIHFESRYFVILFDDEGTVIQTDTNHIFAISEEQSVEYAKKIHQGSSDKGFYNTYRYGKFHYEGHHAVICLDCFRSISHMRFFLFVSILVSFAGWIAVFVIVFLLSGKIVEPVSKSYEKQKQFITDAGHEIKTPLAIIQADVDVIEMSVGENEWLSDIKLQLKRLTGLTNDLIRLSKLDEGKSDMNFSDFPISELALELSDSFLKMANSKGKQMTAKVEPNLTFKGEMESISKLISIVLDNAVKYSTGEGNIRFELKKKSGNLIIETVNQAENINKENVAHLFERFYRADSSRNSQTGGYGIGLSMAKAIVEAHGGKISGECLEKKELKIKIVL